MEIESAMINRCRYLGMDDPTAPRPAAGVGVLLEAGVLEGEPGDLLAKHAPVANNGGDPPHPWGGEGIVCMINGVRAEQVIG